MFTWLQNNGKKFLIIEILFLIIFLFVLAITKKMDIGYCVLGLATLISGHILGLVYFLKLKFLMKVETLTITNIFYKVLIIIMMVIQIGLLASLFTTDFKHVGIIGFFFGLPGIISIPLAFLKLANNE